MPWQYDENRTGYMGREECMSQLRAHQPEGWNPTDPPTRIANDVHSMTCEEFGFDDYSGSGIKLYTALGSALDKKHGIDAWIELPDDEAGETVIVKLDFTRNPDKYLNGHKADVIVYGRNPEVAAKDIAEAFETSETAYAVA